MKRYLSTIFLLLLGVLGLYITIHIAMIDQSDLILLIICAYVGFISLIYVVGHFIILLLLIYNTIVVKRKVSKA